MPQLTPADPKARRHPRRQDLFELAELFLAACVGGDLAGLLALLAPEVRLVGDGGGRRKAPLRVIETAGKVARFLHAIAQEGPPEAGFAFREINGAPAVLVTSNGVPHSVFALETSGGRVSRVYVMTNPEKLGGVR